MDTMDTLDMGGGGGYLGGAKRSVGGTFGGLTLFNTANHQEVLDCNHSKAHTFKRSGN